MDFSLLPMRSFLEVTGDTASVGGRRSPPISLPPDSRAGGTPLKRTADQDLAETAPQPCEPCESAASSRSSCMPSSPGLTASQARGASTPSSSVSAKERDAWRSPRRAVTFAPGSAPSPDSARPPLPPAARASPSTERGLTQTPRGASMAAHVNTHTAHHRRTAQQQARPQASSAVRAQGREDSATAQDDPYAFPVDLLNKTLAELTYADVRGLQDALLELDRTEASEADLTLSYEYKDEDDPAPGVGGRDAGEDIDAALHLEADYDFLKRFLFSPSGSRGVTGAHTDPGRGVDDAVRGESPAPPSASVRVPASPDPPQPPASNSRRTLVFSPPPSPSPPLNATVSPTAAISARRGNPLADSPGAITPATPVMSPAAGAVAERTPVGMTHTYREHCLRGGATVAADSPGLSPVVAPPSPFGYGTPLRRADGSAPPSTVAGSLSPGIQLPSGPAMASLPHWQLSDFDVGRKLGEGRFGKTYLARQRHTRAPVALKCLGKDMILSHNLFHQVEREIELQQFAGRRCPHVLPLHTYFWDAESVFLVLEYAEGGNLADYLKYYHAHVPLQADACGEGARRSSTRRGLPESEVRCFVSQIAEALSFLHEHRIVHRDVKPENVLLKCNERTGKKEAKLADFSWCVQLADHDERHRTFCGTLDYLSPEQVQGTAYGPGVDTWALGVLTYELLCGCLPFEHLSASEARRLIAVGGVYYPDSLSAEATAFLKGLLCVDPVARLSASAALRHPFLVRTGGAANAPSASAASTTAALSAQSTSLAVTVSPNSSTALEVSTRSALPSTHTTGTRSRDSGGPTAVSTRSPASPTSPHRSRATHNGGNYGGNAVNAASTLTATSAFLSLTSLNSTTLPDVDEAVSQESYTNGSVTPNEGSKNANALVGTGKRVAHHTQARSDASSQEEVDGVADSGEDFSLFRPRSGRGLGALVPLSNASTESRPGTRGSGSNNMLSALSEEVSVSSMSFTCHPSLTPSPCVTAVTEAVPVAAAAKSSSSAQPRYLSDDGGSSPLPSDERGRRAGPAPVESDSSTLNVSSLTVPSAEGDDSSSSIALDCRDGSDDDGEAQRRPVTSAATAEVAGGMAESPLPQAPQLAAYRRALFPASTVDGDQQGSPQKVEEGHADWGTAHRYPIEDDVAGRKAFVNRSSASLSLSMVSTSEELSHSQHGISRSAQRSTSSITLGPLGAATGVGGFPAAAGASVGSAGSYGAQSLHSSGINSGGGAAGKATARALRDSSSGCVQRLSFDGDDDDDTEDEVSSGRGDGGVVWNTGPVGAAARARPAGTSTVVAPVSPTVVAPVVCRVPSVSIVATKRTSPTTTLSPALPLPQERLQW